VLERQGDGRLELGVVVHLADPNGGAEPRGLDEAREPEGILDLIAGPQCDVARDRDAAVAEHLLEEVLVHAERGCGNARPDVRDAGKLEQALNGPVLAERAVQDRQHDIDGAERRRRVRRRNGQRLGDRPVAGAQLPASVTPDRDRHDLVAVRVERLEHGTRRGERDLVLGGATAGEDGDPEAASH
jgi:hypothetical protein